MPEDKKMPQLQPVSDGHERRLQNVEHDVSELKTDVAENKLNMSFVAKEMKTSFDNFGSALQQGFDGIQKRLDEGEDRMTAMADRIGEHGRKFEKFDEEKRRSAEKWDSWKKWIAAAVTGAIAIGLKELMVFLAHRM
jgi:chromosome segregation ATPase